jgi:hypothetical protein
MIFSFGQLQHERIEIDVQAYEQRAATGDYWDDNWISVEIRVRAGGFRGKVYAAFLAGELTAFLSELRPLYETLGGAASFTTMEEQLSLRLHGDGKGHIELEGEVSDQSGIGNCLHFKLQFDQTNLATSIRELEQVTSKFPVRLTNRK